MLVIVIGRGAGGTRLISSTLAESGIYMGPVNDSGDMIPPEAMYEAVRVCSSQVRRTGRHTWDFTELLSTEPSAQFKQLVEQYIQPLRASTNEKIGWKIPETTLAFPWIIKMFPEAYYIHWTRDPRDAIARYHLTDRLWKFGVPSERQWAASENRLESYLYQRQLVAATPKPERFHEVQFEDFVLHQDSTLAGVSGFLDIPLVKVPVIMDRVTLAGVKVPQEVVAKYAYAPNRV